MYRCIDCGEEFYRPAVRRRSEMMPEGYLEHGCYWVCPRCGAAETELEEVMDDGRRDADV